MICANRFDCNHLTLDTPSDGVGMLVVIDPSVPDYQMLAAGVRLGADVLILEPHRDAIGQITMALAGHGEHQSLHVICHGAPGKLYLGKTCLSAETLAPYRQQLREWGVAEILLLSCEVAAGNVGTAFVEQLSRFTGANIAASAKLKGTAAGADWELEVTGKISSPLSIAPDVLSSYNHTLSGTTRYWDGGGDNNYWSTPANWSDDKLPTQLDRAVFDDTSSKDVVLDVNPRVFSLSITPDYTGTLSGPHKKIFATENIEIEGGTVTSRFYTNGDLTIGGGTVSWLGGTVRGNTTLSGGDVTFHDLTYLFSGDFIRTGAMISGTPWFLFATRGNSKVFDPGPEGMDLTRLQNKSFISKPSILNLNGEVRLSTIFANEDILNILDGSVIDAQNVISYFNEGTIDETGSGKILHEAEAIGFTNADDKPVTSISPGDDLYIILEDADENLNNNHPDTTQVTVKSLATGDEETLILTETTNSSGLFRGFLPTQTNTANISDGTLQHDGTEDLQVTYTDDEDTADVISRNLNPPPITWDGEGDNNLWSNPLNWSEDSVPTRFDRVLFDGTSSKDVEITKEDREVYSLEITSDYTGELSGDRHLITLGDIEINGGIINGRLNVGGDLTIGNGVSGMPGLYFHDSGKSHRFTLGSDGMDVKLLENQEDSHLNLDGEVRIKEEFINEGTLNIPDGSILDAQQVINHLNAGFSAQQVINYSNEGTINETGNGKIIQKAEAIGFSDINRNPVTSINPGENLYIMLSDRDENINGSQIDRTQVTVRSLTTGDSETFDLIESPTIGGEFMGGLPTASGEAKEDGILQHDGIEDLEFTYTDPQDPTDIVSRSLKVPPVKWDGGGSDNKWSNPLNWSGDYVPTQLDRVIFDDTSSTDVELDRSQDVYSLDITSTYTGKLSSSIDGGTTTLSTVENLNINGGNIDVFRLITGGNLTINNGTVSWIESTVRGDTIVSGGAVTINNLYGDRRYSNFYGDFTRTGGTVSGSTFFNFLPSSDPHIFTPGPDGMNVRWLNNESGSELHLNGDLTIEDSFYNINFFKVLDGSTLVSAEGSTYTNYGTVVEEGTGQIQRPVAAMGVTDANGTPRLDPFKADGFGGATPLIVSLVDLDQNLNGQRETVEVELRNLTNGDIETVTLTEINRNAGEFRSPAFPTAISSSPTANNGIFESENAGAITDSIKIVYVDPQHPQDDFVISINSQEIDIAEPIFGTLDFGRQDFNAGSTTARPVIITNTGDTNLNITGISLSNYSYFSFASSLPSLPTVLAPDETLTVDLNMKPGGLDDLGEQTATLLIDSNDSDEPVTEVILEGTYVSPPITTGIDDVSFDYVSIDNIPYVTLDLYAAFDDRETPDAALNFQVSDNSNPILVATNVANGELNLFHIIGTGTANITVTATDSDGMTVDTSFNFQVSPAGSINHSPTVSSPLQDLKAIPENPFNYQFPANTFNDEEDGHNLTYSVTLINGESLDTVSWLSFDPATRTFSGIPSNADIGTLELKVTAEDSGGAKVSNSFNLIVDNNIPPHLERPLPDQTAEANNPFSFQVPENTFLDLDGDPLTYNHPTLADGEPLPSWLSYDPATRSFSGTPEDRHAGTASVKVTATDSLATVSDIFDLTVTSNNNPPTVVTPIPNRQGRAYAYVNFPIPAHTFTDVEDGNNLTYTATRPSGNPLPEWLTFYPATRRFRGYPDRNDVGTLSVKVTASDRALRTVSDTFDIEINLVRAVIDGYIAGSTVFLDTDGDLTLDEDELFTYTDVNGIYELEIPEGSQGNVVAIGGIDRAHGLPLSTPVTAIASATSVTLLASLVADLVKEGLTVEEANEKVTASLSLSSDIDLSNFDPIFAMENGDPIGVEVFSVMVKVQNFITQTMGLISGAADAIDGEIVSAIIPAITSQIQANTSLNFSDATQLETMIGAAATNAGVDVSAMEATTAQVMAEANQRIDDIVANTATDAVQVEIAQVQKIALGQTTAHLKDAAAGNLSFTDLVIQNTGDALDGAIANALVYSQLPTDMMLSNSSVGEGLPKGTEVGTLHTIDIEAEETHTYSLVGGEGDGDNDAFQIVGNSLQTSETFDYESKDAYSILVQTTNGNGGVYWEQFTINVIDAIAGTASRDALTGTDTDDIIIGKQGRDTLTGGEGADQFVYTSILDAGDIITDFQVGSDKIVLAEVFDSFDYSGSNPIADGYLKMVSSGSDSIIAIDPDGPGSGQERPFILVQNLDVGVLENSGNFLW